MTANDQQTSWKFNWLTRWEEIWDEDFVRQWQVWLDNSFSAHVFFHPAMVKAWVETYMPLRDIRPCFLVAESDAHTVFFPLVLWWRNWKNAFQRLLVPVGYSDYDYHDPIIVGLNHTVAASSFWRQLEKELNSSSPIKFDRLDLDGIRQNFIPSKNDMESKNGWRKSSICPWIDLRAFKRPEEFLLSLKTSLRQDLRRQQRRMSEIGETQYLVFTEATEQQALQELPVFLAAHTRRWPDAYKAPGFFERLVHLGLAAKILHFSAIRINYRTAAWHLLFIYRDRMYSYLPTHEKEFENLSPSKILLLKNIEDAIARGLKIYDFLRGGESYKTDWTDKTETLWSLRLDRNHLTSRIRNAAVDRAKPWLKTLLPMK